MENKRVIYYYQTFDKPDLSSVINNTKCTHIHVASVHFGKNQDGTPYIHLNDTPPNDPVHNNVWKQTEELSKKGVKIILMVGGAGGAYVDLFSNFDTYYGLLKQTIEKYSFISGIDLDVEEYLGKNGLEKIRMLIRKINNDFGDDFIIAMAPVQSSLASDGPGMGGFSYKDLYNSPEGKMISYFNAQSYGSYSVEDYQAIINNGYPPNKVVFGMLSSQYSEDAIRTVRKLCQEFAYFGGVYDWEYFSAQPTPENWSINMSMVMETYQQTYSNWLYHMIF